MPAAQSELQPHSTDTSINFGNDVPPALVERPVDPNTGKLEKGRQELAGFLDPVASQTLEGLEGLLEEKKEHGIPDIKDISLPDEVILKEAPKWYHVHKHIGNAVTWLVEQVLRRDKKQALE